MSRNVAMTNFVLNYSRGDVPPNYTCAWCNVTNRKLWRKPNPMFVMPDLACAKCAAKDKNTDISEMDERGRIPSRLGPTDQLGSWFPAVPTEDNTTFWGYSDVPQEAVIWWRNLPNHEITAASIIVAAKKACGEYSSLQKDIIRSTGPGGRMEGSVDAAMRILGELIQKYESQ